MICTYVTEKLFGRKIWPICVDCSVLHNGNNLVTVYIAQRLSAFSLLWPIAFNNYPNV
jgi:hypothetical protein